jgi:hypothetical protein
MEIQENSKGRGSYSTKEYQPWDLIHVESAIFSCSSMCNKEYTTIAKQTKDQHVKDSFLNKMLTFISRTPDDKIAKLHPQLKFPVLYLLHGGKVEAVSHLAQTPKIGVNTKQIEKAARMFKISKDDLKLLTHIFQANGFSIPGLLFSEIGMALFDKGSMFNHCCNPNAFSFITYDKMMIYARKSIYVGEEITISYKPLCIPDTFNLLEFTCQCGHCDRKTTILNETYYRFSQPQQLQDRIDYMLERSLDIPTLVLQSGTEELRSTSSAHVELLIESYYELWPSNKTYREKDLYEVLRKFQNHTSATWIESQLLALILSSRLNYPDHQAEILEKLKPFVYNRDIIEHIVVVTTIIPHMYHSNLINILAQLELTP